MARFARDCRNKMQELTKELESELGTDTGDLALRTGLHSGPTTAGVLRGDKSRFQLFGDTVNTAARHEAHSQPNRIQVSQQTADLLMVAGKGDWLRKRPDKIQAKGKDSFSFVFLFACLLFSFAHFVLCLSLIIRQGRFTNLLV